MSVNFAVAHADGTTEVGRYLTEKNGASVAQRKPLMQTFELTFPGHVQTVGQAITYLLSNTSYQLVPSEERSMEVSVLLTKPLPLSDRHMGTMSVKDALLALAGTPYQLLIDPEHRYVSFQLKPNFRVLYQGGDYASA